LLLQIKLLATRIPQYAFLLQGWASEQLTHLQDNFGSDVVNDKLRDVVSSQGRQPAEPAAIDRDRRGKPAGSPFSTC